MSLWLELYPLKGEDAPWVSWQCCICDQEFKAGVENFLLCGDLYVCTDCAKKHGEEETP